MKKIAVLCLCWLTLAGCDPFRSRKALHFTTATAVRKEHVVFSHSNREYTGDDGTPQTGEPGDEQWRIYFKIGNFNDLPEDPRKRAMDLDAQREKKWGPWFWYNHRAWFDKIAVGSKLSVGYQIDPSGRVTIAMVSPID